MKIRIFVYCLIPLMSLLSCTKEKGTIYTVDFSSRDFPQKSVDLDEYVDSWRKVILETDSLCLVDKATHFYPCKEYIIVYSPNKIMMFDYDGEFIKNVAQGGNGPGEINYLSDCVVDEENQILYYLEIFDTENIHSISLKDGSIGVVPIAVRKMLKSFVFNTNGITCFRYVGNKSQSCYTQDLMGNLLDTAPLKIEEPDGPFVQSPINLYFLNDDILYQGLYEDTVYDVTTHLPVFVFSKGKKRVDDVNKKDIQENQIFFNTLFSSGNNCMLTRVEYVLKATDAEGQLLEMIPDEYRYYLYNHELKDVNEITGCTFSPTNKKYIGDQLPDLLSHISSLNPQKVVLTFPAEELGGGFDDNPILFVGDLKK